MSLSIDLFLSPDIIQKYLDEHFLVVICIIVDTRVPHVGWIPLPLGNRLQTLVDKCVLLFGLHHEGSGFPHPVDEVEQVHRVKFVNSLKNSQTCCSKWLSSILVWMLMSTFSLYTWFLSFEWHWTWKPELDFHALDEPQISMLEVKTSFYVIQ